MTELITIEELEKEIKVKEGEIKEIKNDFNLNIMDGGNVTISSLQVAEIFNKQHKTVLRKIREILKGLPNKEFWRNNFVPSEYIDERGKHQSCYIMNRAGFSLLGNRFTGDKSLEFSAKYVEAFETMDNIIKELIELNYKRNTLLLEQQKHYIYSAEQEDYCVITGICGYSNNYLYQAVIDYNNKDKAKIVKTKGYNNWASLFKEKAHDKLISYVKEKNIDLTKDIYVTLLMQYPRKFDLINFEKGLCDQITLILKDIEPTFDDKQIKTLLMNGINDSYGYDDSIIAIRIQN